MWNWWRQNYPYREDSKGLKNPKLVRRELTLNKKNSKKGLWSRNPKGWDKAQCQWLSLWGLGVQMKLMTVCNFSHFRWWSNFTKILFVWLVMCLHPKFGYDILIWSLKFNATKWVLHRKWEIFKERWKNKDKAKQ